LEEAEKKQSGIKAIAMDMSPAYIDAVRSNLSNARIVFDHFHVNQILQ